MKSQEYRIGNVIFEPESEDTKPFKIWSIYQEEKNEKINGYPIGYFKPVLLTEEWLLKLGLERKSLKNEYVWGTKHYMFLKPEFGWYFTFKRDGFITFNYGELFVKDCQFVHQLQNLYFALTNEELTINELY